MEDDTKGGRELEVIAYAPTDGLTYNPNEPKYWDNEALNKELTLHFDRPKFPASHGPVSVVAMNRGGNPFLFQHRPCQVGLEVEPAHPHSLPSASPMMRASCAASSSLATRSFSAT